MKSFLALVALICGSCAPAREHRVNVTIKNETGRRVIFWAAAGLFGREIALDAGETQTYWVDRRLTGNDFTVTLR